MEGRTVVEHYKIPGAPVEVVITDRGEYLVQEPPLSPAEHARLEELMAELLYILPDGVDSISALKLNPKFQYYVLREVRGYGLIDAPMKDPSVEDIIVVGAHSPVAVVHTRHGTLTTNIFFDGEEEVMRLAERLAHRCGKSVSAFSPTMSVRMPEGHRLTITYGREVSHTGTGVVIRKFPERPWSITRVMVVGTIDPRAAALIMLMVESKMAGIVFGGMGTGKTSMINALCNLIPADARIVTIEDSAELRLAHPYWKPLVVRESYTVDRKGEISAFHLLKHALRMSVDYVIVGEVRGEEGRDWAQAVLTGHGGLTSFHAAGPDEVIERLTTPPINLELSQLRGLHFMLHMARFMPERPGKRVFVRRAVALYNPEFGREDYELTRLVGYDAAADTMLHVKPEDLLKTRMARYVMELRGWDEDRFLEELDLRERFLQYLLDKAQLDEKLMDFEEVTKLIWEFHRDPRRFKLDQVKLPERVYMKPVKRALEA